MLRDKLFQTPVGRFSYRHQPEPRFSVGITQASIDAERRFLIAKPEKALADLLWFRRGDVAPEDVETFLCDDMRVDRARLARLALSRVGAIAARFHCRQIDALAELVKSMKGARA
jgi:hypothetical protein